MKLCLSLKLQFQIIYMVKCVKFSLSSDSPFESLPGNHEILPQETRNSWLHHRGSELWHHRTIQNYNHMPVQFQQKCFASQIFQPLFPPKLSTFLSHNLVGCNFFLVTSQSQFKNQKRMWNQETSKTNRKIYLLI